MLRLRSSTSFLESSAYIKNTYSLLDSILSMIGIMSTAVRRVMAMDAIIIVKNMI